MICVRLALKLAHFFHPAFRRGRAQQYILFIAMLLRPKSVEEANAALRQCRIRSLDCTQMKLGDGGCIVLSEGLSHNTTLQTLFLWHQKISHDGVVSIAPAISRLPALRELNFYRNRLGTCLKWPLLNSYSTPVRLEVAFHYDAVIHATLIV